MGIGPTHVLYLHRTTWKYAQSLEQDSKSQFQFSNVTQISLPTVTALHLLQFHERRFADFL
jgi:hypothetical protein